MKVKVWKDIDSNMPSFPQDYKVTQRWEGNCTEISKNSNKFYHAEIQVSPDGKARIFTMYGRVGKVQSKEYRYYNSESDCIKDYNSLVNKKKNRKHNPYREVDLAISSVGSEKAKEIKKPMEGIDINKSNNNSLLHKEVQRIVSDWFGITGHFVEMNLKCPLGQLTKDQIDKGRDILNECLKRVNSKTKSSFGDYDILTSQFYSLIPHILPHKINPDTLRLDEINRIMEKFDTLDTFLDAKNVSNVLGKNSDVDEKYKTLNANLKWLDNNDPVRQWIEKLTFETRAKNHGFLGKIKIFNVFQLERNNEDKFFIESVERISKEVDGKGDKPKYTTLYRPDLDNDTDKIYKKANIWPLWHGTRPQNMVGIITKGLLIKPSGAIYAGSMFGEGLYHAESSSKSMNYTGCRGSYWSGNSGKSRSFLFLEDVIVGIPYVVKNSRFFKQPPSGYHSVYAIPGSGLYNSENITYKASGVGQQHKLRYIVEFQSNI